MTGFNQHGNKQHDDGSTSKSKFIDVNPVENTGEIPRPPFIPMDEEVNKSSLRNIINAVNFPGMTSSGDSTDGAGASVRLRSEYTLVEDTLPVLAEHQKRRSKFRLFR